MAQDMKIELNTKIELLKKSKTEIKLKVKYSWNQAISL